MERWNLTALTSPSSWEPMAWGQPWQPQARPLKASRTELIWAFHGLWGLIGYLLILFINFYFGVKNRTLFYRTTFLLLGGKVLKAAHTQGRVRGVGRKGEMNPQWRNLKDLQWRNPETVPGQVMKILSSKGGISLIECNLWYGVTPETSSPLSSFWNTWHPLTLWEDYQTQTNRHPTKHQTVILKTTKVKKCEKIWETVTDLRKLRRRDKASIW